jgi:hypothetical protein
VRALVLIVPLVAPLSSLAFAQSPSPRSGGTLRFHVKSLVPHQVVYDCCRLQDVWLDR